MEADNIRNNIIDKLLTISNKEYLSALYQLVQNSSIDNDIIYWDEFLGFPAHDPHGDPIPQRDGVIKQRSLFLLSELIDGQKGIVSGVVDHSSVFLQYLEKMNLVLGKQIFVSEQNQFDKSYQIILNETDNLHISVEVAKNVLVRLI